MSLIECVPNVSEGRRADLLDRLAAAALGTGPDVRLLDRSADPSHHRSVYTLAGPPDDVAEAVLALADAAVRSIDLQTHDGVHPRLGALDVVPFVPLAGSSMAECVALARRTGKALAARWDLPVYLYEEAASSPARRLLGDLRRGGLAGLAVRLADPAWRPDFGPARLHPTAGAAVVGARRLLVAFNINLASAGVDVARAIAVRVRESSGGLPSLRAIGVPLAHRGLAQVSMNLTDLSRVRLPEAYEAVAREAANLGVALADSEIVGLVPAAALGGVAPERLGLRDFTPQRILEVRLREEELLR